MAGTDAITADTLGPGGIMRALPDHPHVADLRRHDGSRRGHHRNSVRQPDGDECTGDVWPLAAYKQQVTACAHSVPGTAEKNWRAT